MEFHLGFNKHERVAIQVAMKRYIAIHSGEEKLKLKQQFNWLFTQDPKVHLDVLKLKILYKALLIEELNNNAHRTLNKTDTKAIVTLEKKLRKILNEI